MTWLPWSSCVQGISGRREYGARLYWNTAGTARQQPSGRQFQFFWSARKTLPDGEKKTVRKGRLDATSACERTFWKAEMTLDTLAAAYAEVGDFEQAVKYQRQALECGDLPDNFRPKVEAWLALYQQGKPCRE
jgi:hypothetical protein